jgi:hypothetical protein
MYAETVKSFLEDRGLLKLGLEKSELEKITIIRSILLLIIVISIIIFSGSIQLIVGILGIILGVVIMYYSYPIYRLFATGQGNSKFRGDNKIKLIGLIICIVSAGWMSGITQTILYTFLSTANLIPQNDLIDYY